MPEDSKKPMVELAESILQLRHDISCVPDSDRVKSVSIAAGSILDRLADRCIKLEIDYGSSRFRFSRVNQLPTYADAIAITGQMLLGIRRADPDVLNEAQPSFLQ